MGVQLGADWRHPYGPGSSITELMDHPVVHVTHDDASAYAVWAGKAGRRKRNGNMQPGAARRLRICLGRPTRAGRPTFCERLAGRVSLENLAADGFERTSPVGTYPPNGFGLFDMIGNVWEWTDDWYRDNHPAAKDSRAAFPSIHAAAPNRESFPMQIESAIPRKTLKGGSHLCAPCYCRRYRPAARHAQPIDTSASHIGFRCIRNASA